MTLDALRVELGKGELRGAYLLAGPEPLLRDDALAALRAAVLGDGPSDFDFDRLDGQSTSPAALQDSLATLPVLAPRRLVILREPESQRGSRRGLPEALEEAVPKLADSADAVLVVVAEKTNRRTRWVRAFDEAAVVRCDPPRPGRELAAFVRAEAKRQGVEFERGVPEQLAERVGPQLLLLRQEIAKVALYAGIGERVTRAHVSEGACDVADEPIWDLTDAIGEGRMGDALQVLARISRNGAPPPVVLGSLGSHFRRLLRVRSGDRVPGPPFVTRKLEKQAGRYAPARLLACLRAIHEADLALKGQGGIRPELTLERLVIGLAS